MSPILKPLGSRLAAFYYHSIPFSSLIQMYTKTTKNIHTRTCLFYINLSYLTMYDPMSVEIDLILFFHVSLLIHAPIESHVLYMCHCT